MKKEYMKPFVEIVEIDLQNILSVSGTEVSVSDFTSDDDWDDESGSVTDQEQ